MNHRTRSLTILGSWLLLAITAHARTVTYVYTDPQGTPLAEADANGNITARFDYTPYGQPVTSMGAAPNGPGYTGHVNDPDTGLVYMQARYYDPVVGMFLSIDPVGPEPGSTFNFNRYAYAYNNPLRYTDPDGRCPWCAVAGAVSGAVIGASTAYVSSGGNWRTTIAGVLVAQ
ncbi:RHS repeat-associated core domain-containing protein [Rhodanobacter caeni]|uniref:Teneurin-like YD-shell domain-containing protein n=1 Tax=Rhodanobacter caeni TaxID=657654 RepID=A0ABP3DU74_9GAMM